MDPDIPINEDVVMETICAELGDEIDTSLLDDIDLYLECDDDDVNFSIPPPKDFKNVIFKVSFYPGNQNEATISRRKFVCCVCQEEFTMETKFKVHMAAQHGESKPFLCDICSYKSSSRNLMTQHYIKAHKIKKDSQKIKNGSQTNLDSLGGVDVSVIQFTCCKCPYVTDSEEGLVSHFDIYHNSPEKPFTCDQCDFICKQKKTFTLHKKKHLGMCGDLVCEICGKEFLTKTQFNRHYKIHNADRPFQCSMDGCNKGFKLKGALTDHVRTVHGKQTDIKQLCECMPRLHHLVM